jgi:hypothetical protein
MLWRACLALAVVLLAAVAAARIGADEPAKLTSAAEKAPPSSHVARCGRQSIASFPDAFTSPENLVVGPLAMIGARRPMTPAGAREFGGNKYPLLVRAGRTVTVAVARRSASLFYASRGGGGLTGTEVSDGHRAITFRSCGPRAAESDADGDPVTFWSGFVLVARPMCVPLKVWIGAARSPRRAAIPLGKPCTA